MNGSDNGWPFTRCYVDESIHDAFGVVVTAFVFAAEDFELAVSQMLSAAGIETPREEFKSSARMDADPRMRDAREGLIDLVRDRAKIALVFSPFYRPRLGRQVLQALQSVLVRNGIVPSSLQIHFDREIFASQDDAKRLQGLFHFLKDCRIHGVEDSKVRVGIQVADAVAHSFGQIIKSALSGNEKLIDIGGDGTGYPEGTQAPLSWALLMSLRYAMLTRPTVYNGETYRAECDPVVLDPLHDDPVDIAQHPTLLGWGIQVAPESDADLRQAVEKSLGRLWLGCIH